MRPTRRRDEGSARREATGSSAAGSTAQEIEDMSRLISAVPYPAAASLAVTTACAVDGEPDLDDGEAEIIGGAPIGGDAVAAIGVVGIDKAGRGKFEPTCTGVLVAPSVVLTAEHCVDKIAADKIVFQI